jgi:ABC-type transport system involved in multi-copper enzyme maturation permease subunit
MSPPAARRLWPWPRVWGISLVTFRQAMRMRLWILAPLAIVILILADLYSPRFDPVFESIPAATSTSLFVMAVLAVVIGIFLATYSIPAEVESRVAFSVVTKPVSRAEIVAGKTLGMSLLVLAMLAIVGLGAYIYISIRAGYVQALAVTRLEETRPRAVHPADLNALEAAARHGPLMTFRYRAPDLLPETDVHFAGETPSAHTVRWVLGETGMRLIWNLSETHVAEWAQSGPCAVRVGLATRRPQMQDEEPVRVSVALVNPKAKPPPEPDAPAAPVTRVVTEVPQSGLVEISILAADAPPAKGVLNLPPPGELFLEITAEKAGFAVGAKASGVRLVGPAGQKVTLEQEPVVQAAQEFGRVMLVGRPELPRPVAVFRFAGVPGGILGPGDTAVEIGMSVDAWAPAMIQPAAEATFRTLGGKEQTFRFTPEGTRSTVLYIDRNLWHGGPLEVRLECLTADDFLGLVPQSVRLRLDGGPFAWHFAKAGLYVWLFGTVLAAAGVALSTRFTWFVSILGTIAFFILGISRDFILHSTAVGALAVRLAKWSDSLVSWRGWLDLTQHLVLPLPDLRAMMPSEAVSMGRVIPLGELGAMFGWAMLGVVLLWVVGTLLFRSREVAA